MIVKHVYLSGHMSLQNVVCALRFYSLGRYGTLLTSEAEVKRN